MERASDSSTTSRAWLPRTSGRLIYPRKQATTQCAVDGERIKSGREVELSKSVPTSAAKNKLPSVFALRERRSRVIYQDYSNRARRRRLKDQTGFGAVGDEFAGCIGNSPLGGSDAATGVDNLALANELARTH